MVIDGDHPTGGTTSRLPVAAAPLTLSVAARRLLVVGAALWLVGIGYGVNRLRHFESTPGVSGITPGVWPATSALRHQTGRSTLIMMVHPQCSCTRASLSELNTLMRQAKGQVSAYVLFIRPTGMEQGWEKSPTWSQAERIPGVSVRLDPKGAESTRFGALTSGHTVVYDPSGQLLFSGGITSARGHAGENKGSELILAQLARKTSPQAHAVFGCPLADSPVSAQL
jgi:hypothetical protein